jgi:hypothetical protein
MPRNIDIVPGIYMHQKSGRLYRVHFIAKDTETLTEHVIYEALYNNPESKYWSRPVKEWLQKVKLEGRKNKVPRFKFINKVKTA